MDHENIRVDVSVKARGIAAAHEIIAQMTADNINTELAKVGLRSASVLVPAVLVTAQSAGELLLGRVMHRLLHLLNVQNIHTLTLNPKLSLSLSFKTHKKHSRTHMNMCVHV